MVTPAAQKPPRILVIDDERFIAYLIRDVLLKHGYDVETSGGGVSALRCAIDGDFSLVISDFAIPGLNGLDFARRLRDSRPDAKVVIVSAFLDGDTVDALAAEPNVARLLRKPFDIFELLRVTDDLIGQSRVAARGGSASP